MPENVVYRVWKDKKAMIIASIEHVFERTVEAWRGLEAHAVGAKRGGGRGSEAASAAERLIDHEAKSLGRLGHHRIVFAGLSESDDAEVRSALARMYRAFQRSIRARIGEHRGGRGHTRGRERRSVRWSAPRFDAELAAWAIIGLGTIVTIGRGLRLMPARLREVLLAHAGRLLLDG